MVQKIFSFDAETNGLWGEAFAIAAVVKDTATGEVKTFLGRCPIDVTQVTINPWVRENVLPQLKGVPCNYDSYRSLLKAFMDFYMAEKENAQIIVHMGLPVEARLFLDAHKMGIIGDWDAPFPLIDISALPEIGTSVDSYNKEHNLDVPFNGSTHNPIYDSWAALLAYEHWTSNH